VFPSLAEPLGTSLLAAMAWGLAVLAVASGGVPEYVEDDNNGLLVPRLMRSCSQRMLRLLNEESLRMRLAERPGEQSKKDFQRGACGEYDSRLRRRAPEKTNGMNPLGSETGTSWKSAGNACGKN